MESTVIREFIQSYAVTNPSEVVSVDQVEMFLHANPINFWQRSLFVPGHLTVSACVVNPERTHMLLMHHIGVSKWVQLGGHIEAIDASLQDAALREVREESGFTGKLLSESIFDIDVHVIPVRPSRNEPEHTHFDIRFLVEVPYTPPVREEQSTHEIVWVPLAEVASRNNSESVTRMCTKLIGR